MTSHPCHICFSEHCVHQVFLMLWHLALCWLWRCPSLRASQFLEIVSVWPVIAAFICNPNSTKPKCPTTHSGATFPALNNLWPGIYIQNLLKLFKLANPTSAYPHSPISSCRDPNKGSHPHLLVSPASVWTLFPHVGPVLGWAPSSWDFWV